MSLDGFLTVLALAAAIYAVVPPVQKLRARLALAAQIPGTVLALALVLYLEFFDSLGQPCAAAIAAICETVTIHPNSSWKPNELAFLVVIVWMATSLLIHRLARPGALSIPSLRKLIDELVYERRFAEAIQVSDEFLPLISSAAGKKLWWQRFGLWLAPERDSFAQLMARAASGEERSKPAQLLKPLSRIWPEGKVLENSASDILRLLYRSKPLLKYITEMRPNFGVRMLSQSTGLRHEFCDSFLKGLFSASESALFRELAETTAIDFSRGYVVEKTSPILYFLFGDARIAESLGVWKPVGDQAISTLQIHNIEYVDFLRKPSSALEGREDADSTLAAIHFFDIMIRAAAYQQVSYHMWLYYLPPLVERLLAVYDTSDPAVDLTDEFPTVGSRILYEMVSVLVSWATLVRYLPQNNHHRRTNFEPNNFGASIPISACIALGECIWRTSLSVNLGRFSEYVFNTALMGIRNLSEEGNEAWFRGFMISSIVRGGRTDRGPLYRRRLRALFAATDPGLQFALADFEQALAD